MKSDKSHQDEVYRAIGRNVLILQKMEGMLKALVMCANLTVPSENPRKAVAKRKKVVSTTSMGRLVNEFIDSVRPSGLQYTAESVNPPGSMFSMNVTFENELFVDELEKSLRAVVQERNDLIHKKLLSFDIKTPASCRALVDELKAQEARIEPQFKDLATILVTLQEAHADVLEQVTSREFDAGNVK